MAQSASAAHTSFRPARPVVLSFSYVAFSATFAGAELPRRFAFIQLISLLSAFASFCCREQMGIIFHRPTWIVLACSVPVQTAWGEPANRLVYRSRIIRFAADFPGAD